MAGDGSIQVKDGEVVILEITIDGQNSIINSFDFVNQDSSSAFTLNIAINFTAITDLIKAQVPPEELEELKIIKNILTTMRALGEANISATMEMKSIDFDTYLKIVEIEGLKEAITRVGGVFVADMIMTQIEPFIEAWHKIPGDLAAAEEIIIEQEDEKMKNLIKLLYDIYYVKEVLPNTKVNEAPVYNFVLGIDIDKAKSASISFIVEMDITDEEKERAKAAINKHWPEIKKVIEKIDSRIYICQKTYFTIKKVGSVNIDLYEFMTVLELIMQAIKAEVTSEERAEFEKAKEAAKNISIAATVNVIYSDHNVVPAILPPEEYEIISPSEMIEMFEMSLGMLIMPVAIEEIRQRARDATRRAEIRTIWTAMEMYHATEGYYLMSATMPQAIGDFLLEVPRDPLNNVYGWINNVGNPQKFCVWADLEANGYFAASERGVKEIDIAPTMLNCW